MKYVIPNTCRCETNWQHSRTRISLEPACLCDHFYNDISPERRHLSLLDAAILAGDRPLVVIVARIPNLWVTIAEMWLDLQMLESAFEQLQRLPTCQCFLEAISYYIVVYRDPLRQSRCAHVRMDQRINT